MIEINRESPFYSPDLDEIVDRANQIALEKETYSGKKAAVSNIRKGHDRVNKKFFNDMKSKHKRCPMGLYFFLRSYIWRNHHTKDIYKLYYRYYLKGILAATYSMDKLAEIFGVSKDTVNRWLKSLRDEGWIEYGDKVGLQNQNTYIFGMVNDDGEEIFYADNFIP
jgi:DNA-binding transcriptional ArsR family regulator